jgi:hypothetical protein
VSAAGPTGGQGDATVAAPATAAEQPGATTFDSLGTWNALTGVLARSGPRHLLTARRCRSGVHETFRRWPVIR